MNTAAAKRVPRSRSAARPCEDTSIAMAWHPAWRPSQKIRCRSSDSGVVRVAEMSRSPNSYWIVPMMPQGIPAARRMSRIMKTVVVLPFVPVTPTTWSLSEGWP